MRRRKINSCTMWKPLSPCKHLLPKHGFNVLLIHANGQSRLLKHGVGDATLIQHIQVLGKGGSRLVNPR